VADYQVSNPAPQKLKKRGSTFELKLDPAPDILASVTGQKTHPFAVGFAAETQTPSATRATSCARSRSI
jgi:phosphopantothenoylcysteine decarboxylase/phosphopantothenate--cysteine ligase